MLILTTKGRRSGLPRSVGLNYALHVDAVYVMSGFGYTDWYRNLLASPPVRVRIGTDSWLGDAVPVIDPARAREARRLFGEVAPRQGPPRAIRGLMRRLGIDYDDELRVLDRPDLELPIVELRRIPRGGSSSDSGGRVPAGC